MAEPESEFAPPESPPQSADLRALASFAVQRSLRIGANAAMFGLVASLLRVGDGWTAFALGASAAVVLWLPTTGILFRITFFGRPPDGRFVGADGEPVDLEDMRSTVRAQVTEYLLGSLPLPLAVAVLAATTSGALQVVLIGLLFGLIALVGRRALQAVISLTNNEIATDLALGSIERPHALAERLARLPGRPSDHTLQLLGRARFAAGDLPGATEALDRIRRPDVWGVGSLRAQLTIGAGDLDDADEVSRRIGVRDRAAGAMVEALVDLHHGRAEAVAERADELLAAPSRPEVRRTLAVLVAASLVGRDPDRARGLLREHGWSADRLTWLRTVWPPVGEALGLLDGW